MFAQHVDLKIRKEKTEVMMLNVPNPSPVKVNGEDLPTTKEFTYLDSTVMSGMTAEQAATSRIASTRPGTTSEC